MNEQLAATLRELVEADECGLYRHLWRGIGTTTARGARWLNARSAIAAHDAEPKQEPTPLDRMAENARELGLYDEPKQEPAYFASAARDRCAWRADVIAAWPKRNADEFTTPLYYDAPQAPAQPLSEAQTRAQEFAGYVVDAARRFIDAVDSQAKKQALLDGALRDEHRPLKCDQLEQARDDTTESMRALHSAVHEFYKRAHGIGEKP